MKWIKVFSPATIGNIGPGFDVLGLAVQGLGDTIEARKIKKGIVISEIISESKLSSNPKKNTVTLAAKEVLKLLKIKEGIEFKIRKGLPAGSGLGSSAASAAAGAFAANYLYGNKLTKKELILPATLAEQKVSGGFFADNTAPALLGGATLTRTMQPLDITKIGTINNLVVILVTPNITILTSKARKILPKKVPMEDFVHNMANTSLITAAFAKNDYNLFARSLQDHVIEPYRKKLIDGFDNVRKAAIKAGANGMAISGSGPTVFSITNNYNLAKNIEKAMNKEFNKLGIKTKSIITKVENQGTKLID
ncbi:MAG: homoserine kinase [Candidatus Woesearchaeota archaeon]